MNRAVLALLVTGAACAEAPDAETILKRVAAAYTGLKSYGIEAVNVLQTSNSDFDQSMKSKLVIAFEAPGKFRVETKGMGGITTVSNGSETWRYNAYLKQYTRSASAQSIASALASGLTNNLLPEHAGESVKSAKLVADEELTISGSAHPCYVLEVQYERKSSSPYKEGPARFWIDQKTYLVLKRFSEGHIEGMPGSIGPADVKNTFIVESLKLDQPLAPELFSFTPPATAKLVDSFEYPGMKKSDLVGKPAADFKLRDLSDKEVQLASYRGKTVLLDFWATWCAPCRAEMPLLQKLHEENKDLVLLGIDVGEDMDVVQKFVMLNKIRYPILLAGHDRVVNDYDAHSLPTVVIVDNSGNIRTYKTGYGTETEAELRTAIMAAAQPMPAASQQVSNGIGPGAGTSAYRIGGGVSAPSILYKTEPSYSEEARKAHVAGTVQLTMVVHADGIPDDIKVVRSLGYGLDEKAVEAVRTWRFRPGMKDGKPVAVFTTVEVNFRLLDGPNPAAAGGVLGGVPGGVIGAIPSIAPPASLDEPHGEPQSAEEAYRRASHLLRTRRTDEGIAMLGKAIAMKPDWAQAYLARARAQYQQKRYNEAIKDFDEAIRLAPKNASWYDSRGLAYSYSGRHARAIEDYTRAIELNPSASPLPYNNRGWAYTELGQPEKAIADLTRAIEIAPDYPKAYENRGIAYMRLENWKNAIADYTAAIELAPSRWLFEKRAEAKRASGDSAGAGEDLAKAAGMPMQQTQPPQP